MKSAEMAAVMEALETQRGSVSARLEDAVKEVGATCRVALLTLVPRDIVYQIN